MAIVYACIAPHGGNLLREKNEPTPVPLCRAAMAEMEREMRAARPETVAILTPHGIHVDGRISIGVTARAQGELDGIMVDAATDIGLAAAWAYEAAGYGVPVAPLAAREPDAPLPLDWGVVIPLALLMPNANAATQIVVACPARDVPRPQIVAWGEALAVAAGQLDRRVALIVSADQGHGHSHDGPYGYAEESVIYDRQMIDAVQSNDLQRLLEWPEEFADAALADSYWQTLALIGLQKRVPMRSRFRAYEVDHYFGLLCASFLPDTPSLP
jgi:aromatic ring-opening dioxygenase LigB subunit